MTISMEYIPTEEFTRIRTGLRDRYDRSRAMAGATRFNALYSVMRAGSGHLGSSFSSADIVNWLLLEELNQPFAAEGDIYFSSKGHDVPGLYACLIGLGALDEDKLHQLRRLGGLPGHPDVSIPHMHANTGSLGMGISRAKGMILADRLKGIGRRVFVLTGDGELQEGQIWESLAGAVHHSMSELTVIVDHNKLQSDTWVANVSDLGDLEAKFRAFGWDVFRCDGHSMESLEQAFASRRGRSTTLPAVIIADTVKGAGCDAFAATSMPAGERRYQFHSGAPSLENYSRASQQLVTSLNDLLCRRGLNPVRLAKTRIVRAAQTAGARLPEVYGQALARAAELDSRIVALDADLKWDTGLTLFAENFPQRFFECGIAEQDMVSMAGGLAARGLIPFVHSFACFLHARPNEQIYNNASERTKVVYVGSLAGLIPATPGHSHQGVRDVSALGAVPGLIILEPVNSAETIAAVQFCIEYGESVYLRLVSTPVPSAVEALGVEPLKIGRGRVVRPGSGKVVAIGAGPIVLDQLLRSAELLSARGLELQVVALPWHNTVDSDWLDEITDSTSHIFVIENHYARGGQADLIARALMERTSRAPTVYLGVGITEWPLCGLEDEVLQAHGLSAEALADRIFELIHPR